LSTKRVRLKDIASRVGISVGAVSLALRNHHSISPKRRKQVQQVAEKMGYRPDPFLSGLAAYRQNQRPQQFRSTIAWFDHWQEPVQLRKAFRLFEGIWRGASQAAIRLGYHLEDIRWPETGAAKKVEGILHAQGIHGILIPPHRGTIDWGNFKWHKFALVRIGGTMETPRSNLITSDWFGGAKMAVSRIHQYGYRRIGLVAGRAFEERFGGNNYAGFCWAQHKLGLDPALPVLLTDFVHTDPEIMNQQKSALQQWLLEQKPDAILTTDAEIPVLIQKLGYRIPEDIAVAGTNILDIPVDAGINQVPELIGKTALETLVKQINLNERGEPPDPIKILVRPRWQDGRSLPPLHTVPQLEAD